MAEAKIFNKVIFNGQVLVDLTKDTVLQDKVLSGYTFHDKTGNILTGSCDFDSNTQDASASANEILKGQTAYVKGVKVTGDMPNNGAQQGVISALDDKYMIKTGFHDGSGSVTIDTTEKEKIKAENIRDGVVILGVRGSMTGLEGQKLEEKVATPSAQRQVILPSEGYNGLSQVTVEPIPYSETQTEGIPGSFTVTIGAKV